jgi:glycosyltransferase involved in cell wall biosynthesis
MRRLSIVVPALNERENIQPLTSGIPFDELNNTGWQTELVIVDNASTDGTGDVARSLGARVVDQPDRGYGNAYMMGFAAATGEIVATGDADLTYPFDALPELLEHLDANQLDFLSTNRLLRSNRPAMKRSHAVGNRALSVASRMLFASPFTDSQSGMWVFRREIWPSLDVRSPGMGFSQELKHEAYLRGFRCDEVPIEYRPRGGVVKLNATRDGIANLTQLIHHRRRVKRSAPGSQGAKVLPITSASHLSEGLVICDDGSDATAADAATA